MATKRMTSNDYAKELHKLELDRIALEKRMRARVNEMCQQNPYIMIGALPVDTGRGFVCTKDYINQLENVSLSTVFTVMQIIEEELAKQHPQKQLKLYPEICNCDKRDMPVYKEDGKYWCPQCGYEVK